MDWSKGKSCKKQWSLTLRGGFMQLGIQLNGGCMMVNMPNYPYALCKYVVFTHVWHLFGVKS